MPEFGVPLPSCALKVSLQCCKKCPIKVKKELQKINGVLYINIDTEKGLVLVSGTVDPLQLQKAITEIGKRAKILVYEEDPKQAKEKIEQLFKTMERVRGKNDHQGNKNCCGKGEKNTQSNANQFRSCVSDSDDENDVHYGRKQLPHGPGQKVPMHPPDYGMGRNAVGFGWHDQRVADTRLYTGYHGLPSEYARPYYASRPYGYSNYHPDIYSGLQPPITLAPLPPVPPRPQAPLSNIYATYSDSSYHPPIYSGLQSPLVTSAPLLSVPPRPRASWSNYSGQKEPPAGNSFFHSFSDDNVRACNIM